MFTRASTTITENINTTLIAMCSNTSASHLISWQVLREYPGQPGND